jgi:hypothetical protein
MVGNSITILAQGALRGRFFPRRDMYSYLDRRIRAGMRCLLLKVAVGQQRIVPVSVTLVIRPAG